MLKYLKFAEKLLTLLVIEQRLIASAVQLTYCGGLCDASDPLRSMNLLQEAQKGASLVYFASFLLAYIVYRMLDARCKNLLPAPAIHSHFVDRKQVRGFLAKKAISSCLSRHPSPLRLYRAALYIFYINILTIGAPGFWLPGSRLSRGALPRSSWCVAAAPADSIKQNDGGARWQRDSSSSSLPFWLLNIKV